MTRYIYELPDWPSLRYDSDQLLSLLTDVIERRGLLIGRLEGLALGDRDGAKLDALSAEVIRSSQIEGVHLDLDAVRSSVAQRLGIDNGGISRLVAKVDDVVEMTLDATERYEQPLTTERLFRWHSLLFPTGRGPLGAVRTGAWRDDLSGPMQIVSGPIGRERVHYQAPPASQVDAEMSLFLHGFAHPTAHPILHAGLAHLWFETIHPFDDGNGRIGRAILDMALARSDRRKWRCYSISSQILLERNQYYEALNKAQTGSLDVTPWLAWYLQCLGRALESAADTAHQVIARARFWAAHSNKPLNDRQRKGLARMLHGWEGNMTNKKWQTITGAIDRTAQRDLAELVELDILQPTGSGRSTSYKLSTVA